MEDYLNRICTIENLMMAWRKLEKEFEYGSIWFDTIRMASYKMNLDKNLRELSHKLLCGSYSMKMIKPVPFPKGKSEDNELKVRQSFYVDIEDQLVWVAVCNIIGWKYDKQMPAWSYGHRLYLYMWKEDEKWHYGNYRHSNRLLYRTWKQSWPAYRKNITASLQLMAHVKESSMSEEQQKVINENRDIDANEFRQIKLKYLEKDYFPKGKEINSLYWMGLDLEKFYQKIKITRVKEILIRDLNEQNERLKHLLEELTHFKIDYSDYPPDEMHEKELKDMQLDGRPEEFLGLPTGLIVAGFLSNVFMLDIDNQIDAKLNKNKKIIHYRYVDDHVFISSDSKALYKWVKEYILLLESYDLPVNTDKFEPENLLKNEILENVKLDFHKKEDAEMIISNIEKFKIDPRYPTPLLTQTLNKVSNLSKLDLHLLNDKEFDLIFDDLQALLVTDIPEQEIKKSTRISFACTMLSRLLVSGDIDYQELYRLRLKLYKEIMQLNNNNQKSKLLSLLFNNGELIKYNKTKNRDLSTIYNYIDGINTIINKGHAKEENRYRQVFDLMKYSLKQVPDKIKVWIRALKFCAKHYTKGVPLLYDLLIELVERKELSNLSAQYIFAVLNLIRAELIVTTTANLIIKKNDNDKDVSKKKQLLSRIWNVKTLAMHHAFVDDSLFVLDRAASFYNEYAAELETERINNESIFLRKIEYHGALLDECFWLRWADAIINGKFPKENNERHILFQRFQNYISLDSNYYSPSFFVNDEHPSFDEIIINDFLSISQWIEIVKDNYDSLSVLNSEWMATNIMLTICDHLPEYILNNGNVRLTPNNIFIEERESLNDSWNHQLSKRINIKLMNNNNEIDLGKFYFHPLTTDDRLNIHTALPYCLAIIFLQLLTKKSSLSWVFDRPEYGFEWQTALNRLMRKGHISSYNYRIINSCLSARSRETRFLFYYLGNDFINDTNQDNPEIKNWEDFHDELRRSEELLRLNLISVSEGQYRQLTVIDLN